eukprot:10404573-Ditylum_brightwellii.AAC.1
MGLLQQVNETSFYGHASPQPIFAHILQQKQDTHQNNLTALTGTTLAKPFKRNHFLVEYD